MANIGHMLIANNKSPFMNNKQTTDLCADRPAPIGHTIGSVSDRLLFAFFPLSSHF